MSKRKQSTKPVPLGLQDQHLKEFVVRPLARKIVQQKRATESQFTRVYKKVLDLAISVEMIARHLARQSREPKDEKPSQV